MASLDYSGSEQLLQNEGTGAGFTWRGNTLETLSFWDVSYWSDRWRGGYKSPWRGYHSMAWEVYERRVLKYASRRMDDKPIPEERTTIEDVCAMFASQPQIAKFDARVRGASVYRHSSGWYMAFLQGGEMGKFMERVVAMEWRLRNGGMDIGKCSVELFCSTINRDMAVLLGPRYRSEQMGTVLVMAKVGQKFQHTCKDGFGYFSPYSGLLRMYRPRGTAGRATWNVHTRKWDCPSL